MQDPGIMECCKNRMMNSKDNLNTKIYEGWDKKSLCRIRGS
jgi:hypothetical protein